MRRTENVILAAMLAASLVGPSPATATEPDADADLREALRAQGEIIQQLRDELGRVREDQRRNEDRVRALEDQEVNDPTSGVDADYVDRRIEQFQHSDESRLFLSGYAKAEFRDVLNDGPSTFNVQFNPIFHFRLTDKLHFNAELEFELDDGGETEIELEFATIDYLATDWLTLSAGKFLTPFNVFGPKIHPTWINKMASRPVIYDKSGGVTGVLSDVGIMASGGTELWSEDSKWNYAVYLTNGAIGEEDGVLEFENTPDADHDKAFGGRLGFLPIPNLEVGFSGQTGKSRDQGRYNLIGADFWYSLAGFELRSEYSRAETDRDRWGYYVQGAYDLGEHVRETTGLMGMLGRMEPVVRWGETMGAGPNRQQVALGLVYWLYPSVPLKFTYELNSGGVQNDRFFLQVGYGF